MKKITIGIIVVLVLATTLILIWIQMSIPNNSEPITSIRPDYKNTTYTIDNTSVTLINGKAESGIAPGSASKTVTQYFGNEVHHDFDGDGRVDDAFILTQTNGGTGVFYYIVVALNTANGYIGSHALLLGDRIIPQSTEMGTGNIIVINYLDRNRTESFTVEPSVKKIIWLLLDAKTMQFGEVAQNFEGEADPSRMTLTMQPWNWIQTLYSNDTTIAPKTPKKFILTFKNNGTFSGTTDCNGVGGEYTVSGTKITFTKMVSTLMFCEGSQEADFTKMISQIQSFHFTSKGELIFDLKLDTGFMIFK